ncbi:MAG TPA: hypothetical protein VHK25_13450, partial [Acidimicrobiales bacterium]|nr:hypothetical protein [Acidimicrobiales bacterium]
MSTSATPRPAAPALLVAAVGAAAVAAAVALPVAPRRSGTPGAPGRATVVEVIDGDTLVIDLAGGDEHVRLIGIDTPETVA